jgi:hypothetical protein
MRERGCPSADEPTHLNPYWHCGHRARAWVVQKRNLALVIRRRPWALCLRMVLLGLRGQVQHSNLQLLLQGPRAARDLVAHWGGRTVQARREKEARVLVASALAIVASGLERVTQTVHPRVRC